MKKEYQNPKELGKVFRMPNGNQGKKDTTPSDSQPPEPSETEEKRAEASPPSSAEAPAPAQSPYKIRLDSEKGSSAPERRPSPQNRKPEEPEEPTPPKRSQGLSSVMSEGFRAAVQRVKAQPLGAIFFAIPLLVVIYVISLLLSNTSAPPKKQLIEPQVPSFEQPPVEDKPVELDEVKHRINQSLRAVKQPKELRDPDYSELQPKPPVPGGAGGAQPAGSNLGVTPSPPPLPSDAVAGQKKAPRKPKGSSVGAAAPAPAPAAEDEEDADRRRRLERLKKLDASFFQDGVRAPLPGGGASGGGSAGADAPQARPGQVQPGTTVSARLEIGVSTESQVQVVAKLLAPVKDVAGAAVIPAGSTITGTSRAGQDRIYLDFNRATTPSGMKIYFKGYAITGRSPGIPAKIKGSGDSKAGKNLKKATVETAKSVTDLIPGADLAGEFARNVARETVDDVADESAPKGEKTLELAAGIEFQVVVLTKE